MSFCRYMLDISDEYGDPLYCHRPGSVYCGDHKCKYKGCGGKLGCRQHKCFMKHCLNVRLNGITNYCIEHICIHEGCMYGKKLCLYHMCTKCRDRERKPGYITCLNCLTYAEIIDKLLTRRYYFNVIPRDIMNILKDYL